MVIKYHYLRELPKFVDVFSQKRQCLGGVGMEPGEEKETGKMSDGWDNEVIMVSCRLTNTVGECRKVLVTLEIRVDRQKLWR